MKLPHFKLYLSLIPFLGYVKISELPSDFRYDMEWPIKKIPLNRTGYGIEDHAGNAIEPLTDRILGRKERDQLLPETQKFSLELISPENNRQVYIFEIIEVVPNQIIRKKIISLSYCHEEVKGSVTAICDVKEYLLTCVGPKIFIRAFEDNDRLISVAFIDIQIYGNSVVSVKDYILLGDVYKSVWFFGFQEETSKINIADMDKNIHVFQYAPYSVQSFAGQKLIRRGYFHIGGSGFWKKRLAERYYFVYVELLM
ncbi:8742_t:CDS:2 [Funneliformis mosseae]|uniref:8742_t:CDS:1 n=1 Tax=Funneliformis mosseae TaxID=27381 RepID=A0A9N9B9C0_FUNMO|nr:8742_t:CDS:2 [Funneliformis mosseae]